MLVAPLHIRGSGKTKSMAVKRERANWILRQSRYHTQGKIAAALGVTPCAIASFLWRNRKGKAPTQRLEASDGIQLGRVGPAVQRMPWPALDALEAHCARTGLTMAEALADAWVERMEASQ